MTVTQMMLLLLLLQVMMMICTLLGYSFAFCFALTLQALLSAPPLAAPISYIYIYISPSRGTPRDCQDRCVRPAAALRPLGQWCA